MKYGEFEKEARRLLEPALAESGFQHHTGPYFTRSRNGWWDVVFFDQDRASKDAFTVCVGIHIPAVAEKVRAILPPKAPPAPLVFGYLGHFLDGGRGSQTWYRFGKSIPLADAVSTMLRDFETQAIPWLDRFSGLRDVAAEYERREIIDRSTDQPKRNPIAWAMYGLLLLECHDAEGSRRWLSMALEELTKPLYSPDGRRFSTEKTPGAKAIPRPPQERALATILEDILKPMQPA